MFSIEIPSDQRIINVKASLNDSRTYPIIAFGTYQITGRNLIYQALDTALEVGYRAIDTATVYRNDTDIGHALKQLLPKYNLRREDIFITSKLAPNDHGDEQTVTNAVQTTLHNLDSRYIDLYLIHWPAASGKAPADPANAIVRLNTWRTLEKLHDNGNGVLKSIGVSNFTADHIAKLVINAKIIPAVNQVEFHPHWQQTKELHVISEKHKILLQAYGSLGGTGNKNLLNDPTVVEISNKRKLSPSQVLLRWALQRNYAVVPKSITPNRIAENANLNQPLLDEDMKLLNSIGHTEKYAWNPEVVN